MLAKDLAEMLLQSPEAEVIVQHTTFGKWGLPTSMFYSTDYCSAEVDIPEVWTEDLMNRPDEAVVIDLGCCIREISY